MNISDLPAVSALSPTALLVVVENGIGYKITNQDLHSDLSLISPILPKDAGLGIRVDLEAPTFGWHDILGAIQVDSAAGANLPNFNTYRGGLKQFQFASNDQVYVEFHIPHDYVPNSDLFIHTHWSHNSALVVSGGVTWGFEASHAKGHNQAPFVAPINTSITQVASIVQYQHMIAETALSSAGGIGGLLVTGDIEPDSLILVRTFISGNTILANTEPFLHFCDIHYQSTGIATKQRAPDFYV